MDHLKNLDHIENEYTDELQNRGFEVYRGWNESIARQLAALSFQAHILQTTSGDAIRRFKDPSTANRWHNQGSRSIYTLQDDGVAGLIWYDVRHRQELNADYTFAIRMYEASQGKGLALGFMKAAHHDFAERKGNPSVWLDVDLNNPAARKLYGNFGYLHAYEEEGRDVMVYTPDQSS